MQKSVTYQRKKNVSFPPLMVIFQIFDYFFREGNKRMWISKEHRSFRTISNVMLKKQMTEVEEITAQVVYHRVRPHIVIYGYSMYHFSDSHWK
jgi:hypothetical protein